MTWEALFVAFLLSHVTGDFLLQTEWQAVTKRGGLSRGHPEARRALFMHGLTYTLTFVPALIWIGDQQGVGWAIGAALLVIVPHVLIDHGGITRWWLRVVKHTPSPSDGLLLMVDQSMHLVTLFALAVLVTA